MFKYIFTTAVSVVFAWWAPQGLGRQVSPVGANRKATCPHQQSIVEKIAPLSLLMMDCSRSAPYLPHPPSFHFHFPGAKDNQPTSLRNSCSVLLSTARNGCLLRRFPETLARQVSTTRKQPPASHSDIHTHIPPTFRKYPSYNTCAVRTPANSPPPIVHHEAERWVRAPGLPRGRNSEETERPCEGTTTGVHVCLLFPVPTCMYVIFYAE